MDRSHIFLVSGQRGAGLMATGPFDAVAATRRAVEMRLEGYRSITLIDVNTGEQLAIDQYMIGISRAVH
jgi:hypothetical protein